MVFSISSAQDIKPGPTSRIAISPDITFVPSSTIQATAVTLRDDQVTSFANTLTDGDQPQPSYTLEKTI